MSTNSTLRSVRDRDPLARSKGSSLLLMVLMLFTSMIAKANPQTNPTREDYVVEIGDGTTTYYYYPVNMYFNYSLTEQIYTADEIGTGEGTINAISFYYDYTSSFSMDNVTLYMKNVTRDAFASNIDMEPLAFSDIVWTGTLSATEAGWITITLDTPFAYSGGNLLVGGFDGTSGYPGSAYKFRTSTCDGYKGINWYSDSYTPDPYNTASGFSGSKSYTQYRANIQLNMTVGGVPVEGNLTVYDDVVTNAYVPVYGFYGDAYNKTEMVYPALELGELNRMYINSMKFYAIQANVSWGDANFQVFMKEVYDESIYDFYGMEGAALVYEGPLSIVDGEMEVAFTSNYRYFGGNLLVGIYETTTGNYASSTWYGQTVSEASIQGYSFNGLDGVNPAQRNFLPKTTFSYEGTIPDVNFVSTPNPIELGYRPNGAWMRPAKINILNEGERATVNGVGSSESFFQIESVDQEMPTEVWPGQSFNVILTTGMAEAGEMDANLIINYANNQEWSIGMAATAYDPVSPDVWELAEVVNTFPFVDTLVVADVPLYDNYVMPQRYIPDGADAVYELVFTEDTYLNASVTSGENGKVALYPEGFKGEGGPDKKNYYLGPELFTATPFETQIGEGTSTMGYFPFYTLYNYSIAECLYLADELADAGVTSAPMTSLSWYANNAPGYNQQGITIWMANVDDEALTSSSHVVTNMTKVYTGEITPAIGWNEFVFNEDDFSWDGNSNVLIYCQRNNGEWNSTVQWLSTQSMPFTCTTYRYQDSEAYDPTVSNSMYTSTTRPNIIMKSGNRSARNRDDYTYEFENDLDGWTVIDVNADQGTWLHSSENLGGYDYSGLAHGGTGFAMCYSYVDYVGAYNTDSYLVSPQKYGIAEGSTLTFWADNASDSYPENFSVCVSTADTPTDSDFTQVWSGGASGRTNASANVRHMTNRYQNWNFHTVDLSAYAGQEVWIAFHDVNYDMYEIWIDDVTINNAGIIMDSTITNMTVTPGTYYLVASSTSDEFVVEIDATEIPCPEMAYNPYPADGATEINIPYVDLHWTLGDRTTEYRIMYGTTYYCEDTLVDWTRDISDHYRLRGLLNNTNYFWRIDQRNDGCPDGVRGEIWGFTTHLNVPLSLYADNQYLHEGDNAYLYWDTPDLRGLLSYNIYQDDVFIGNTSENYFYVNGLTYNMNGYRLNVTAVYDEGESGYSNVAYVYVSGNGFVEGYVYEQDSVTPVANAYVRVVGFDEFGYNSIYGFNTDDNGYYYGALKAGYYPSVTAKCNGYQDKDYDGTVNVFYNNLTTGIDFVMDEQFKPVLRVVAQYYPDSLDKDSPYVKVHWGVTPSSAIVEDFETGDFSSAYWQLDSTYPWTITTNSPYEGNYCMRSGGAGVQNMESNMTVDVEIPEDGKMSFFGKISSEGGWDYGHFYIDDVEMGSYSGVEEWSEKQFDITQGVHTFRWSYTKDGSVDSYDDCFYVDYISFYKSPIPSQPGWHTYCENAFNNAVGGGDSPKWGYEYPASFLQAYYAGWTITKVSLFSDSMYGAVGGNYSCYIYVGGSQPEEGMLVSTITVDVPQYLNEWVDWDLTTPVQVTGYEPIWVIWQANTHYSSWPAGCSGDANDCGTWWNSGYGWEHMYYGTWTMRQWFTNRSGRSEASTPAGLAMNTVTTHMTTTVKGGNDVSVTCVNPNATRILGSTTNNNRSFQYYRLYRTDAYNDGPFTETNTVLLADEFNDTVFIDLTWDDPELTPVGVYKYGVSCVYEGNRESRIAWNEQQHENHATGHQPIKRADGDDSNGPAPFVRVPENATLPTLRTESSEAIVARWHYGSDFANFILDNPAECYSLGFYNDVFTNGACYMNNTLYFSDIDGKFGTIDLREGLSIIATDRPFTVIEDNPMDGKMYGCSPSGYLYEVNPEDGSYIEIAYMPVSILITFTITNDGRFIICDRGDETIKEYIPATGDLITLITLDWDINYGQDMATDRETNEVYWAAYNNSDYSMPLIKIDLENNTTTTIGYFDGQVSAFAFTGSHELSVERESPIKWSNPMDKNMWLSEGEVTLTVTLNSGDSPEYTWVELYNTNDIEQQNYPMGWFYLDASGYYSWDNFRKGNYYIYIYKDGYEYVYDNVAIYEPTDLSYVLTEIREGIDNLYVSSTGWATWNGPGNDLNYIGDAGTTFYYDFENGWPEGWTDIDGGSPSGYGWRLASTKLGSGYGHYGSSECMMSQSYDNNYGVVYPDNYLISEQVMFGANSVFSFWACAQDQYYAAEHFGVAVSTASSTNPYDFVTLNEWTIYAKGTRREGPRGGSDRAQTTWTQYVVDLSAYAGQMGYVAIRHFNCSDQYYLLIDDVELSNGRSDRHYENIQVELTDTNDNIIYSGQTFDDFMQLPVDDLVEGETYRCKVASSYSSGMTDWNVVDWVYQPCENYEGAVELTAETTLQGNLVSWSNPEGILVGEDIPFDVTVGDFASQTGYFPFYTLYNYSIAQSLYRASELTEAGVMAGAINSLSWNANNTTGNLQENISIWMANVNDTEVSSVSTIASTMTLVYTGSVTPELGWNEFVFNQNQFIWDGTSNVLVLCQRNNGDWNSTIQWQAQNTDFPAMAYAYTDNAPYDVENANYNMTVNSTIRPVTRFIGLISTIVPSSPMGAMVYRDGELLGLAYGNEYLDEWVMSSHDYTLRLVYRGPANCPNENIYFSMSCPQSVVSTMTQTDHFLAGWNWWSTYIEQNGIDGMGMLQESLGENGIIIKSQDNFTMYNSGMWAGQLNTLTNEQTYYVQTSEACTVTIEGTCASSWNHPIDLYQGWNWIGYPVPYEMSVNEAMMYHGPVEGDILKSQYDGFTIYYGPYYGWIGSLNTLRPGMGLLYKSERNTSFVYPTMVRGDETMANLRADGNHWQPSLSAYPTNMNILAVVELDDVELASDRYELAAFANGECRGSVTLMYVEPLHRYMAFLTVAGEDAANLHFGLYDKETGVEYRYAEELVGFQTDASMGSLDEPMVLHFRGTTGLVEQGELLELYPNPVKQGEYFSINLPMEEKLPVRVEVVNALGSVLSVETATKLPASIVAPQTSGVYMVRIYVEGKGMYCRKLVVR